MTRRWLLPADTRAPGVARAHLAAALLGSAAASADDAVLVASELVSNAVRHAHPPIELEVAEQAGIVRISVTATHRPGEPTPSVRAAADADGGAGLRLIEACADDWGWSTIGARLTVHAAVALG